MSVLGLSRVLLSLAAVSHFHTVYDDLEGVFTFGYLAL